MNLNLQCRDALTLPWNECECFDSIIVNGQNVPDLLYAGYQLDLANKMEIKMYDSLAITFHHSGPCDFRILNPQDFMPKEILPVLNFKLNEGRFFSWKVPQNYPDLKLWVQIEQFRWGNWVKLDQNFNVTAEQYYKADLSKYFLKGTNRFRAVVSTIDHVRVPCKEITFNTKKIENFKVKKIKCKIKKGIIKFSKPTYYEVYNEDMLIAAKGFDEQLTIQKIAGPPGKYLLRYGDKEKNFSKKDVHNIPYK